MIEHNRHSEDQPTPSLNTHLPDQSQININLNLPSMLSQYQNNLPKIDYKRELEAASRGMIMIHDPHLLIKLIIRVIVNKVKLTHAGMLLYEPKWNSFVLKISRGMRGVKIPPNFARFTHEHPIIKVFTDQQYQSLRIAKDALVLQDINNIIWKDSLIGNKDHSITMPFLNQIVNQMRLLDVVACVPAFYQNKLLAVLLLGPKKDHSPLRQEEIDFFVALASDTAMAIRNAQLFDELKEQSEKNRDLFLRTTVVLGSAIEAKDRYTHGHTERVTRFSVAIAKKMKELKMMEFTDEFFESLYIAALLHDIGKIGVPEHILNKPGPLTLEEFERLKQHTIHGVEILKPLSELKDSILGVKYHHERYDGLGYPEGLKGEEIPMIAAIIAVADTLDAMTSDRPYRKALPLSTAIEEIRSNIGLQFHPLPAKALLELYQEGRLAYYQNS